MEPLHICSRHNKKYTEVRTLDEGAGDLFSSLGIIYIRKESSAHVEELSILKLLSILS